MDDWFQNLGAEHQELRYLLVFTDGGVVLTLCGVVFVAALVRRRWRLAAATVVTPFLAVMAARLAKLSFGRLKGEELAYPSGHTALTLAVLAMTVLLFGAATWAVTAAAAVMTLGVIGQGVTYHYFTDTIGALFLGSALVCLAVSIARLDTCQPRRDGDHSAG
ncbi:PA-phosphatase [Mycobacterium sp. 236(2023)]|uniref:PA-phosphatase n=1 Tax=Mycobacterium sp. 236(2023) TaxID=3038163 RepID=UPI002415522E|nr:PA-phosphatase [Mycobacterium sp. 236(2023)]MDG4663430.1 PA-phosphatase [Mycobacterium sp. 236(2023)]